MMKSKFLSPFLDKKSTNKGATNLSILYLKCKSFARLHCAHSVEHQKVNTISHHFKRGLKGDPIRAKAAPGNKKMDLVYCTVFDAWI